MKKIFKISASLLAGILAFASCQKEPELKLTDVGPVMDVQSYTESTYMGADIYFSVNLSDKEFALSVLNATLYYGETEVQKLTVRTKEYGLYTDKIHAPIVKSVPDASATLVLSAVNVGMGVTTDTVEVALRRPDFEELTFEATHGISYTLTKTDGYKYSSTGNFPADMSGILVTPEINENGDVIKFGWDGSKLSPLSGNPIPFASSIAGEYTINVDLMELTADPFNFVITTDIDLSESNTEAVYALRQGIVIKAPNVDALQDWDLDPDFFTVNGSDIVFDAVDGFYKFQADFDNAFIKVLPCDEAGNTLALNEAGEGAVWVIGANFGKPIIGPSWNTTDGAYAMAQVAPKVYQFSLNVGSQLNEFNSEIKLFHQMGWGGEFKQENFASFDGAGVFQMTADGNIKLADGAAMTAQKAYRFTLDLTNGVNAAVLKVTEVEATTGAALYITVNGAKADKLSKAIYKVKAVELSKGQLISFSGIENPLEWYVDPDHFTIDAEGLKFNAVQGYYSIELNIDQKFVTVRRVKADGAPATYADEGAITIMGWGVAHPVMTSQLAWEAGALITLAEVEDGVFQFTGIAVEETDGTTIGGRWRYDYLSYKFFGQAGWGAEQGTVTLTDRAQEFIALPGNIELAEGASLELGATYVMTVTDCTQLDENNKFNCTVDFYKK